LGVAVSSSVIGGAGEVEAGGEVERGLGGAGD
jgi:hypothetical protein